MQEQVKPFTCRLIGLRLAIHQIMCNLNVTDNMAAVIHLLLFLRNVTQKLISIHLHIKSRESTDVLDSTSNVSQYMVWGLEIVG